MKKIQKISAFVIAIACILSCLALTVGAKSALTDEELYEKIDKQLASPNRYEGRLVVTFAYELPYEKAVEALENLGIYGSSEESVYYTFLSNRSGNCCYFCITADESQLRELAIKLWRVEEIQIVVVDYFEELPDIVGDIDGNGKTDAKDYMMLKRVVLGTYTVDSTAAADVDGDGKISAKDYMMLKRIVLGTYQAAE